MLPSPLASFLAVAEADALYKYSLPQPSTLFLTPTRLDPISNIIPILALPL